MALDRSFALRSGLPARRVAQLVARELERHSSRGPARTTGPSVGSGRLSHPISEGAEPIVAAGAPTRAADAILRLFPSDGGAAETLAVYMPGEALGSVHEIVDQLMAGVAARTRF